jgi:hypothetical protein
MARQSSILDILESIQAEKIPGRYQRLGNRIVDTFSSWSEYVDSVIAKRVEEKSKKLIEDIAKYHEEHPDFA